MEFYRINFGNVSGFLLGDTGNRIMIDTGRSKTTGNFVSILEKHEINPGEVKLIILTHTHFDHSGGARFIHEYTGARIAVHRSEQKYLENGYTPIPKGTRWKGQALSFIGRKIARGIGKYATVHADILIDDHLDLRAYGIHGDVIHTPGHTEGSLSVLLENGIAFAGDNAFGFFRKEHFPPFANDIPATLNVWEQYIDSGVKTIYPAHGKEFSIEELKNELPGARQKYLIS